MASWAPSPSTLLGTETLVSVALEPICNEHVGSVFTHIFVHLASQQMLAEHLLCARPSAGPGDTEKAGSTSAPPAACLTEDPKSSQKESESQGCKFPWSRSGVCFSCHGLPAASIVPDT